MKILFDQGVPAPLRHHFSGHAVNIAYELGWSELKNGELLSDAEQNGFDLFLTTDQNLKHQQNLANRTIAIIVLNTTSWPRIQKKIAEIRAVIDRASPGGYEEIEF